MDNKFERVESDSPLRCQGISKMGQCPYKRMSGSEYCPMHGGPSIGNATAIASKKLYQLTKWRAQLDAFSEGDAVKSLREEIGILRITMQETLNMCQNANDLLMYSSKIGDLALKIEKLVSSCHRLETSSGMLLDRNAAMEIGTSIVQIISSHIKDDEVIEKISAEIIQKVVTLNTVTKV
jgi:hypothetical protein